MVSIKENADIIVMLLIAIINIILFILNVFYNVLLNYLILINVFLPTAYAIADFSDKLKSRGEMKKMKVVADETLDNVKEIKETVENTDNQIKSFQKEREQKYEDSNLISELINENIISLDTIKQLIPKDKRFISVLCYSKGAKQNRPSAFKEKRLYNEIFEDLGFVKLAGRWSFFIIAEDNIFPKKLRDLDKISEYLLQKGKLSLIKEWSNILEFAKKERPIFYRNRKEQKNPLHFNILVMKTNLRNIRHLYTRNDFNQSFNRELASVAKMNKIKLDLSEHTRLNKFVLQSSINILIMGVPIKDKQKLIELEKLFKKRVKLGGLEIKNFCDYHKRNRDDIFRIINKKFESEDANKYTDLIVARSKDYESELRKFGINIS